MKNLVILFVMSCLVLTSSLNAGWGSRKTSTSQRSLLNQKSSKHQQTTQNQNEEKLLFIQTAREAVIQEDIYGDKGTYVLTLKGIQPNVAYFSDRPYRKTGKVALDQFVSDWSHDSNTNSFMQDNPNGALVTVSTTPTNAGEIAESVMILSEPNYDARNQTLTYKVRNENGKRIQEGRHQNPVLFIDSGCYVLCF